MNWVMPDEAIALAVALGCGLLIGVEREQARFESGEESGKRPAGVRTSALLALAGAAAALLGPVAVGVMGLFVALITVVGYSNTHVEHPGLTTEVSLMLTFLRVGR